jgi:leucyl-tRNA synthetase
MKLANTLSAKPSPPARFHVETLVLLVAPFAPHLAEELYATCFERPASVATVSRVPWPSYDGAKAALARHALVVQVNGKVRAQLEVGANADADTIEAAARHDPAVVRHIGDKTIRKVVNVSKGETRLVNFVVA